jgi:hypothetical protein
VGETLTVEHTSTGTYTLSDGTGIKLTECAAVVTVNATGVDDTAQAVTGEHTITVMTYEDTTPTDNPFSLMVTCP